MEQKIKLSQLNELVKLKTAKEYHKVIDDYEISVMNGRVERQFNNLAVQVSTGGMSDDDRAEFVIDYEVFHDLMFNQTHTSLKENLFAVRSKYEHEYGDELLLPISISTNIITLNPVKGENEVLVTEDDVFESVDKLPSYFVQEINTKYTKPKPINSETSLGVIGEDVVKVYIPGYVLKSIILASEHGIIFGSTDVINLNDRRLFVFDREIMSQCPTLGILEKCLHSRYPVLYDKMICSIIFVNMDTIIAVLEADHHFLMR